MKLSKKQLLILLGLVLTYFCFFSNIKFWFHNLTPEGGKYISNIQIKDDLNYIYHPKYKIDFVQTISLDKAKSSFLEKEDKILTDYYGENNRMLNIQLKDYKPIYTSVISGREVVTREAVYIVNFLLERNLYPNIKAFRISYRVNYGMLDQVGTRSIIIPRDLYSRKKQKYIKMGYSKEKISFLMSTLFIENSY